MKAIDKLTTALKKYGKYQQGEVYTNKDGIKYRYDRYTYKVTPYWLEKMFDTARKELNNPNSNIRQFSYNKVSYSCDKPQYKGQSTRATGMSELIIL